MHRITNAILYYWNNCYTITNRRTNFKYLVYLYNIYKKIPYEDDEVFYLLRHNITEYRFQFILKLIEPIIEFDCRTMRFVIYLFGNQILNFPKSSIRRLKYDFFYKIHLFKIRLFSKYRKIRIGFWVTEPTKWTSQYFYDLLKQDDRFEPFIILSYFKTPQGNVPPKEFYNNAKHFFETNGCKVYDSFDADNYKFKRLDEFKPDIIFYQQPWLISKEQRLEEIYKKSLLCYIPYCFYSMNSHLNYLSKFHGVMWKYFVETEMHKKEYQKLYNAANCVNVGSTKLDGYHFINQEEAEKYWKTKNKKRIIYAPHHSFNDGLHEVATFKENGKFILELAKSHPETEWIFRPHPAFIDRVLKNSIMTEEEINNYYQEWKNIGTISTGGNYYEMFSSSDCLITDCISFLSEYAPTLKPVFHLRKNYQKEEFNSLVSKIDKSYYQIYTNEEMASSFERVIINGDDYLKEKRKNNQKILPFETLASKNIYDYLKKELWI